MSSAKRFTNNSPKTSGGDPEDYAVASRSVPDGGSEGDDHRDDTDTDTNAE